MWFPWKVVIHIQGRGVAFLQSLNPTPFGCEDGARIFYQITGIHLQQNYSVLQTRTITRVETMIEALITGIFTVVLTLAHFFCETGHLLPSSADFRNAWSFISPHTPSS
jgi:cell division inhibitor SulA